MPNVARRENQTTEYYDIEAIEERVYGLSELKFNWSKSKVAQRATRPLLLNGFGEVFHGSPTRGKKCLCPVVEEEIFLTIPRGASLISPVFSRGTNKSSFRRPIKNSLEER